MKIEDIEKQLSALQKRIEGTIEERSIGAITPKKLNDIFSTSFSAPIMTSVEKGVLEGDKDVRTRIYEKVSEMKKAILEKIDDIALTDDAKNKLKQIIAGSVVGEKIEEAKKVDDMAEKISVGTVESRIAHSSSNIEKYKIEIERFHLMMDAMGMSTVSTALTDAEKDIERQKIKDKAVEEVRKLKVDYEKYLEEANKIKGDTTRFDEDKEKDLERLRKEIFKKFSSVEILKAFLPQDKEKLNEELKKIEADPTLIAKYLSNENYKAIQNFDCSTKREHEIDKFDERVKELETMRLDDKSIADREFFGQTKEAVRDMKLTQLDLSEFDITRTFAFHREGSTDDVDLTTLSEEEKVKFMETIVESIYKKGNESIYGDGIKKLEETVRAKAEYKPIIKKGGFFSNFFRGLTGRPSLEQETLRSAVQVEIKKKIDDFAREYRENEEAKERNKKIEEVERKERERNAGLDEVNQKAIEQARKEAMVKGKTADEAMKDKKVFEDKDEI